MKTPIEQWTDEVIRSLDGMKRAEPNPFLLAKIRNRIKTSEYNVIAMPPGIFRLTLACLALLFVINISTLIKISRTEKVGADMEYYSTSEFSQSFNLYEE